MIQEIHETVTIQPGGTVSLTHPDLPAGARADVVVRVMADPEIGDADEEMLHPLSYYIGRGSGCFSSAQEVDDYIRAERDSWDQ